MTVQHKDLSNSELHVVKGASTATSGQLPTSDGSGDAPFISPPSHNYGTITLSGNATATTIADATYTEINEPTWVEGEVSLVTTGGTPKHYMVATSAGKYLVSFSASILPAAITANELRVRVMVAGTEVGGIASFDVDGVTAAIQTVSLTQVLDIAAAAEVSLSFASITTTGNSTVQDASLTMVMLKAA